MNGKKCVSLALASILVLILAVGCPPPVEEDPDYVGTWEGGNLQIGSDPAEYADLVLDLKADGTYTSYVYAVGTATLLSRSSRGSYAVGEDGRFYNAAREAYDGVAWISYWTMGYGVIEVDGDIMTFDADMDQDGTPELTWTLARQ